MTLLEDWCRGMDVNSQRALLVWGIPVNCDEAEIEETLPPSVLPSRLPFHQSITTNIISVVNLCENEHFLHSLHLLVQF